MVGEWSRKENVGEFLVMESVSGQLAHFGLLCTFPSTIVSHATHDVM